MVAIPSIGVVAEDNKRVRYLLERLENMSFDVHLIDADRKAKRVKTDLDYILIVRDYVNHCIIEKARSHSKFAKVLYLDRSSKSKIDEFCDTVVTSRTS